VFLGLVHRIDRPVSGMIVFARTSKAASRLVRMFREREINKTYIAVVKGALGSTPGRNQILPGEKGKKVADRRFHIKLFFRQGSHHEVQDNWIYKQNELVGIET